MQLFTLTYLILTFSLSSLPLFSHAFLNICSKKEYQSWQIHAKRSNASKILLPELFLKFSFFVVFFHPHFCSSENHFNQTDQFASLQKERQEDRSFKIGIGREKVKNSGKLKSYLHIFHHHDIIVAISKREMSVNLIVWRFPLTCQI